MTDLTKQAEALRATFAQNVERHRGDRDASDEAKRRRIARAWHEQRTALEGLIAQADEQRTARVRELHRRLFAAPGEAASYRDAIDRAEAIEQPDVALERFRRAAQMGDAELVRAFALVATERGWHEVVNAYTDEYPTSRADLEEMWTLRRADDARSLLARAIAFAPAPKPAEIASLGDYDIAALAEADQNTSAPTASEQWAQR